ncbi:autotransporter domain-containing protein [Agrobacterium larrymoorei]|uniref:autotransporter domain-containing protein n=1 Tax=Agrobacterium larrymoorei TaxID=160699 RepID=UPI0015726305|nr:autotransporter domain-containing protein [Agrobacterium larrymoorei]NTJ43208.1 autotransporter domain-containing protein [Agrobacterium larrymoorei]
MTQALNTHRSYNSKHTRRLFNTTSLLVLALASSFFAVAAEPVPVEQNGASAEFDPVIIANSGELNFVGLSRDGSTLLINTYDNDNNRSVPYAWRASGEVGPVATGNVTAHSINADGSVYVGESNIPGIGSHAVRVTSDGTQDLGTLGGQYSLASGVSDDGNAVTGYAYTTGNSQVHAFYWTQSTNALQDIGTLGGNYSYASAISGDGTTVIGQSSTAIGGSRAFRWQVGGQITNLGILNGDDASSASAVSQNGGVVAGLSSDYSTETSRVFRWTEAGGMKDIGTLDIGQQNDTRYTGFGALSRDGNTIVGTVSVYPGNGDINYERAYRWHVGNGGVTGSMQELGTLGGHYNSALAVSADGSVVVGQASTASASDEVPERSHGFRWTAATDTITVDQWLRNSGVTLATDVTESALAVSGDGNVVVGNTYDGNLYYARGNSADNGAGIITPEQFVPTIQSAAVTPSNTQLSYANTAMFGAEGSPMRNLLNAGQRSAWGTVDSGYDKSNAADGGFGLGEFGLGYGFADGLTGRLAIGGVYTNQDLTGGGDFNYKGFYVSPEVSANVVSNLYVTLGGYYASGKIDIHRGYLNGGAMDYSDGDTDTRTWGGKLRFDWLNAATIADTAITPYIGLSRANSKVDAYTENGGSFPVAYDDMSDHATIARLGADYVHPLTENVNLLARTEVAHRFEDKSSSASAQILGLSTVNLSGQDVKQWWARGGVGAEFAVGGGTASLMVNASTEGGDPRVWLRSGWKVKF